MSKIYCKIFILLISINCNSQTINVTYSEGRIINNENLEKLKELGTDTESQKKYFYNFKYSQGTSLYINQEETKNYKKEITIEQEEKKTIHYRQDALEHWYYKDYKTSLMFFNIYNMNKLWNGKDNFLDWNWQIQDETKIVNGFKCKKAISNYKGMNLTAWFTEEIAINAGPEKFDGLPGLILFVGSPFFEWEALTIMIDKENTKIECPLVTEEKTYTLNEVFTTAKNQFDKKKETTETKTDGNTTTSKSTIIIR